MNRIASRASALFFLIFLLTGGFALFLGEFFANAGSWAIAPGSPHVYAGGNSVVVDRDGNLLLHMNAERIYSKSQALRMATVHWLGDRYGSIFAPILPNYANAISGFDPIHGVYRYGNAGGVAKLTLSARMQIAALQAMGDYSGTVAVYNYKTGELLCAVTTPTYDPDNLPDSTPEGLYMNRFTQSKYIPGSIFKVVTLAAALEDDPAVAEQTFTCNGSYAIGAEEITCENPHGRQTLKEAFCNSCNCAFARLALRLGGQKLEYYVEKFGITKAVSFDGVTTAEGNFRASDAAELNVAWSGVGQYLDQVNPCAFLVFLGAIGNGGKVTMPYLVESIAVQNDTTYKATPNQGEQILSENTATILQTYLQNNVTVKYGAENFPGITVGAKTGTAEVGGGKRPNAMLAGFVADADLPLAFVVCVEDAGYGRAVCIPIIAKILATVRQ